MKIACPKAAKFNVSKKLSQLNKVIALFMTQQQEREFQLKYLHQKYNPEIDKVIQNACNYRAGLAQTLDKEKENIIENIKIQYKEKYDKLTTNISSLVESANSAHQEKLECVEQETETQKALIKSFLENSKEKQKTFLKNIEASKADLSDRVNQILEKYKAELKNHSAEANKRVQQCKKDSEERLKQLQDDHNNAMIQLRGENKVNASFDRSKYEPGLQKLRDASQLIMGHKNKILQMKESILKSIQSTKSQIDSEIKVIQKISKENDELLLKMDQQVDEIEKPNQEALEELKRSQQEQLSRFSEEELQKKKEFEELCARLNQEYEEMKLKNKDFLAQFNSSFGDLKRQQAEELEALKNKNQQEINDSESAQEKLKAEIKQEKAQFKKLKSQISAELDELRKKHEAEKSDIGHNLFQEREAENRKHQGALKILKDKINAALGDDAKKGLEAQENLNALENEKQELIRDHKSNLSAFSSMEEDELDQLKTSFNNRSIELKNEIATSLDKLASDNKSHIQSLIDSNNKKKSDLIEKYRIQNENELNGIQKAGFSKDEYNMLESNYQNVFDQCQNELNQIQPPKLDDNELYKKLVETIKQLTKDVDTHSKNNQDEKEMLIKKFQEEEENENKRHKESIRPYSSGRNRDQAKIGMMKQLDDLRTLKNKEIARYNQMLDDLIEMHRREAEELENEKEKAMQKELINGLQNKLDQTKQEGERQINEKNGRFDMAQNSKNKEIESTTIYYIQESAKNRAAYDQLVAEFEKLKNELLQKINSIQKQSEKDLENSQRISNNAMNNLANNHSMTVHGLNQEINSLKTAIPSQKEKNEKTLKDYKSQRQNEIDEYSRTRNLEIGDIKNKWIGMEEFFKERLAVLTDERNKFKTMFEKRPSRECDLENIEMMTEHLKMIQSQLAISLRDYTKYKAIYVQQEKKYNAMFGKSPRVGTLQFNPSPRATHA